MAKLVTTCPFCGSIPKLFTDPGHGGQDEYPPVAYVKCLTCFSRGPVVSACQFDDYVEAALVKWNFRHEPYSVTVLDL